MNREIRVGLVGCGVIGSGVIALLRDHAELISRRAGRAVRITVIADKDPNRLRAAASTGAVLLEDAFEVVERNDVDIVVELMGGVEVAEKVVQAALEANKHVVTANKALLAERGEGLFELARARGRDLYFEAAVAGGIPVIRALRESLSSDRVLSIRGIINGTSNYVLSRMANEGVSFDDALEAAQAAGFAEADPTLDISGGDAGHKLAILAALAFGARVSPSEIPTEGIDQVDLRDIRYARDFGFAIRPLAIARRVSDEALDLRVHPALVPQRDPLAHVEGELNAIAIEGQNVGPSFLLGLGAGAGPTATSVVSDVIDIGRNMLLGGPARTWSTGESDVDIQPIDDLVARYYLRCSVKDQSGVLAAISGKLSDFGVSIEKMVQDVEAGGDGSATLAMLTHEAREGDVRASLAAIDKTDLTTAPTHMLRVVE